MRARKRFGTRQPIGLKIFRRNEAGENHAREPALIVSRRFRDWFMTQKVPCEWWPVVLE